MAKAPKLVRPGLLGRGIRVLVGAATLSVTWGILVILGEQMWRGILPLDEVDFWVGGAITVFFTSWVVSELAMKNWGFKPLLVALAGSVIAGIISFFMEGNLTGGMFTTYLWVWMFGLTFLLGFTLILAGAVGQPGCEMRVYASLDAKRKGGKADAVACKGGIDKWDHIGSPDSK